MISMHHHHVYVYVYLLVVITSIAISSQVEVSTVASIEESNNSTLRDEDEEDDTSKYNSWDGKLNWEQILHKELLTRYAMVGKTARPVKAHGEAIKVWFGMRLIQVDLDEKQQTMTTSAWLRIKWYDNNIVWDPRDFGGLKYTRLSPSNIWVPDIGHVNTPNPKKNVNEVDVRLSHNGRVFWYLQEEFVSACLIDLTEYPFDRHECHMWFQSHSNAKAELSIIPYDNSPLDLATYLSSFKESQEWTIIENMTELVNESREVGVMLKYSRRPALRFSLFLARRASFSAFLLLVPAMCLGTLTLLVYCIPPDRADRNGLAMGLFSSLMLLLLLVTQVAPPTAAAVPKIARYYAVNMAMIVLTLVVTALVSTLLKRGSYELPVSDTMISFCRTVSVPLRLGREARQTFNEIPSPLQYDLKRAQGEKISTINQWRLVSRIADRLAMVIHAVILLVCYIVFFPSRM